MVSRILILIGVTCLSATGCSQTGREAVSSTEQPREVSASAKELKEAPAEMLSSFSVSGYTKGGERQWDLKGKSADILSEEINLSDVTGRVYGKQTNMTIVADAGSLNRKNNNVHLEKNVQACTDDGATLSTDYLDWDAQNQRLSSESPVWIKRGMLKAYGRGLLAEPSANLVELKRDVTVELSLETEADNAKDKRDSVSLSPEQTLPTVITCDGPLEVNYQNNLAIFNDNVKVKDKRGEISADKMDVYFATQNKEGKQIQGMEGLGIEKIVAEGSVEIHHGGNVSYSQKAVYDTDTGRLTLTGQPKLVIYSTEGFSQLK